MGRRKKLSPFWESSVAFPLTATLLIVSVIMYWAIFYCWIPKYNQSMSTIAELKCPMMQYNTGEVREVNFTQFNLNNEIKNIDEFWCNIYPRSKWYGDKCGVEMYYYSNFTTGRYIDGKIECFKVKFEEACNVRYEPIDECGCRNLEDNVIYPCKNLSQKFTLEEMGI